VKIGVQTWGSDGDIRPFLALAGGLRAGGHEVSVAVTSVDNKDYSSYGKAMDFTVSQVGKFIYDDKTIGTFLKKIERTENSLKQVEIILHYYFNPAISEMYEAAERLCRENDAIIGHFVHYPAQTAAEKAGKPYATVMLNHMGIYSKHSRIFGVPNLGTWMNPYWRKLYHFVMDRSIGREVNKLRKKAGLPPVDKIGDNILISKRLNLVAETSAICRKQPDWADYHHVCGFFAMPGTAEQWTMPKDLKTFLEAGPSPVYMTLGSMFSVDTSPGIIAETLVQGALLAGCRAIIQAPWDQLAFPDHPNIYKIQKAPHHHIFPHCAAVVHHGGAGTTHSALLHGCPSIIIEHIADQSFWANELYNLGVAPRVLHRRNVTARKLAKAIKTVLDDPGMKKRAEDLSKIMLKENGVQTAVELIEKHLCSS
jgi:UDP:flavonoid glycosyltransferase YjiC (YdhE family)